MPADILGRVEGFTSTLVHVRTIGGTFDLPHLSTYSPVLDDTVTIQDGVVVGAVITVGATER